MLIRDNCLVVVVVKKSKSYADERRVLFVPEDRVCRKCASSLRYSHAVWRKHVITLAGPLFVTSHGYRCSNPECPRARVVHRSAEAEALSLRNHSYGMDILAHVGHLRFSQHLTRKEIWEALQERNVSISERGVQNLYEAYSLLLSCTVAERIAEKRSQIEANGGMIISLDGVQPEWGNETLWVVREVLTGTTLAAKNLATSDTASLMELLRPVSKLGLPILGVVSDAQKAIRLAVSALFPGAPHQLCHFHFLKDIALLTINEDRAMKTDMKVELRGIKPIEERVAQKSDQDSQVVKEYATALRAVLLEDGRPPFDSPGVKIYERLEEISQSLERCLAKRGPQNLNDCSESQPGTDSTKKPTNA